MNLDAFPSQNVLFRKVKGIKEFSRHWEISFLREGEKSEEDAIKANINQFINNSNELPIPGMCFVCPNPSDPKTKLISCVEVITGPAIELDTESQKQVVEFFITMLEIRQIIDDDKK